MLATLIPLFDDKMSVCAYSVFARKENHFLNPEMEGGARYDGAGTVHELEVAKSVIILLIKYFSYIFNFGL